MNNRWQRAKPLGVALAYIPLLLIYCAVAYLGTLMGGLTWIWGVILMALAIPFAILGSRCKTLYALAIAANAAGTGFITSYYYLYFEISVSITQLIAPTLVGALIVLLISCILYALTKWKGIILFFSGLLSLGGLITSAVLWAIHGNVEISFSFFISILTVTAVVLLYAVIRGDDENEILRDTAFASFGVLIIVGFVVLLLVAGDGCDCDGGCVDCCDCPTGEGRTKRRNKR